MSQSLWRTVERKDGLEFFVDSIIGPAPGATGGDLWIYTLASTAEPWSGPVNLGSMVNDSLRSDLRPAISFDGTELYFHSNRSGGLGSNDLYVSRREKLKGNKPEN